MTVIFFLLSGLIVLLPCSCNNEDNPASVMNKPRLSMATLKQNHMGNLEESYTTFSFFFFWDSSCSRGCSWTKCTLVTCNLGAVVDALYTPSIRESKTPKEENSSGLSYFLSVSSDKLMLVTISISQFQI